MITEERRQAVLVLWNQQGLTVREIAEQLRIPCGSVYYILRRKQRKGKSRRHTESRKPTKSLDAGEREYPGLGDDESRCPGCGALVSMPCLACWLAESKFTSPWLPETENIPVTISCGLQGDDLVRYLHIKHCRDFGFPASF